CPVGTSSVTAHFTGPVDGADPDLYANVSSPDSSRNVAIELQRITGSINAGSGKSIAVDVDNNRQAIFDMRARIFSVAGDATAGHISAMVVMNFTYN
ncbi:fimbrial protein, partial [Klebsiella michiganensis]